jgi:hypothetical protein
MKRLILILLVLSFIGGNVRAQDQCNMYNVNRAVDIPIAVVGFAGTGYGLYKRFQKPVTDSATILALSTEKMNRLDRGATTHYSKGHVSDALFVLGVTSSWVLFTDKEIKKDSRDIRTMYLQTIGLSAMGYALTAGTVNKYRPYAYNKDVPMKRRCSSHAKNSFYCGHPSVMAAGAFFTAKVYSDYYPHSVKSRALWSYAVASTITCGVLRYRGGYHFPTDILIGMTTGTAVGILVPTLHKNKHRPANDSDGTLPPDMSCQRIGVVWEF